MEVQYLNTREAAAHIRDKGLPCSPNTLAKIRCVGGGPKFYSFGRRIVYSPAELDEWITERLGAAKSNTAACTPATLARPGEDPGHDK